jgi:hypothetical protein
VHDRIARRVAVPVLTALLVACVGVSVVGFSIWPLAVFVWMVATLLFSTRMGWTAALVGSLVALLAIETILLRLLPLVHVDLALSSEVAWGTGGAVLIIALVIRWPRVRAPARESVRIAVAALAAPVLGGVATAIAAVASGSSIIGWSMRNDAVWTAYSAQHIGADGGIDSAAHQNSSPLMSALMAVGAAPGHSNVGGETVLRFDLIRDGQLWVLVILATSLIAGLIVARAVGPERPKFRAIAAFAAGCFPYCWYVSGFATYFGFYSSSLAVLLLVCAWALWRNAATSPVLTFGLLLLLGTDALATWAVLIGLPLSLAVVVFVRNVRAFFDRSRPVVLVAWMAAAVQFGVYGLFVSLPDFRSQSAALAGGGGIQGVPPYLFAGVVILTLFVTLVLRALRGRSSSLVGTSALVVGALVGLSALIATNSDVSWSYYPTKLAWLTSILLLLIGGESVAACVGFFGDRRRLARVTAVASVLGLIGLSLIAPPLPRSLLALTPFTEALADPKGTDNYASVLFTYARPGARVLLSNYSTDANEDIFVNFWLLQATAQRGTEDIRNYAYFLNPDDPSDVCHAVESWSKSSKGTVIVETTKLGWAATLHAACPDETFTVRLQR